MHTISYGVGTPNASVSKSQRQPNVHSTLSGVITRPKYKGDYYVENKVKIIDLFTKKQKFLPQEEWAMFKGETGEIVPAIVTEEVRETANEVFEKRRIKETLSMIHKFFESNLNVSETARKLFVHRC